MSTASQPKKGDVVSVDFADPDPNPRKGRNPFAHRIPSPDERAAIRLHGHPFTYVVRVTTDRQSGPRLTELAVIADDGGTVDYASIRSVPVRRLAYTTAQWIEQCAGLVSFVDSMGEVQGRPEEADPKVYLAALLAEQALSLGIPVRPFVAAELSVSTRTVDRLLDKARAEKWFDDGPLPKRPQPKQRGIKTEDTE